MQGHHRGQGQAGMGVPVHSPPCQEMQHARRVSLGISLFFERNTICFVHIDTYDPILPDPSACGSVSPPRGPQRAAHSAPHPKRFSDPECQVVGVPPIWRWTLFEKIPFKIHQDLEKTCDELFGCVRKAPSLPSSLTFRVGFGRHGGGLLGTSSFIDFPFSPLGLSRTVRIKGRIRNRPSRVFLNASDPDPPSGFRGAAGARPGRPSGAVGCPPPPALHRRRPRPPRPALFPGRGGRRRRRRVPSNYPPYRSSPYAQTPRVFRDPSSPPHL